MEGGETKQGVQQIVEQIWENLSATDFRIFQSQKIWSALVNFPYDWSMFVTKNWRGPIFLFKRRCTITLKIPLASENILKVYFRQINDATFPEGKADNI